MLGLKRCEACPSLSTSFPNALSKHASHTFHSTHTHHTQSTSFPNALSIEDCVCPAGFKIALQDGAYARENCIASVTSDLVLRDRNKVVEPLSGPQGPILIIRSPVSRPGADCKCNAGHHKANVASNTSTPTPTSARRRSILTSGRGQSIWRRMEASPWWLWYSHQTRLTGMVRRIIEL